MSKRMGFILQSQIPDGLNRSGEKFTVSGWPELLYLCMILRSLHPMICSLKSANSELPVFVAPPTIYRFLIREDFSKYNLSKLKWASVAGEPLNPVVYDTFYKQTGLKLREGFGQTETTLQIATFPWMEPKAGSMGVPSPQFDVLLFNGENTICEDGEVGQIVIRTSEKTPVGLFLGYYRDEEKTASCHYGGMYYTGDLAWRDEDGYYWFVGRVDDVIKSSGYRIGPFEVESALMTHPAVIECAVNGCARRNPRTGSESDDHSGAGLSARQ